MINIFNPSGYFIHHQVSLLESSTFSLQSAFVICVCLSVQRVTVELCE